MLRSSTEQLSITGRPDYTQERGSSPPQGREIPVRFESWLFVLLSFWHNIFPPEVGVSHLGKGEENNVFVIFFNQYLSFLEHILREIYLEEFSIFSPSLFLKKDCGRTWLLYAPFFLSIGLKEKEMPF